MLSCHADLGEPLFEHVALAGADLSGNSSEIQPIPDGRSMPTRGHDALAPWCPTLIGANLLRSDNDMTSNTRTCYLPLINVSIDRALRNTEASGYFSDGEIPRDMLKNHHSFWIGLD